ncbi:hypothetical protein NpNSSI1_00009426 [Neofusicoccum parvum]|nr:hypothetical protein NpNSSI1_00009426 [Neofusicoccum parvum]
MPGLITTPAARRRSHCLTTDANVTFDPKRGHWIYHPRCPGDIPPPSMSWLIQSDLDYDPDRSGFPRHSSCLGRSADRYPTLERIGPNFYGDYGYDGEDDEFPDAWKTWTFGNGRVERGEEASVTVEEEEGGDGAGGEGGGEEREKWKLTYEELRERELEQMRLLPAPLESEEWEAGDHDHDDEDELPWWHTPTRDREWW